MPSLAHGSPRVRTALGCAFPASRAVRDVTRRCDANHCQQQILIEGRSTAVWPSRLEARFSSEKFRICGIDPQVDFLGTEEGMFRAQKRVAGSVFRPNPDGSHSADKAERILSDNFCGTFDFKGDAAGC